MDRLNRLLLISNTNNVLIDSYAPHHLGFSNAHLTGTMVCRSIEHTHIRILSCSDRSPIGGLRVKVDERIIFSPDIVLLRF